MAIFVPPTAFEAKRDNVKAFVVAVVVLSVAVSFIRKGNCNISLLNLLHIVNKEVIMANNKKKKHIIKPTL